MTSPNEFVPPGSANETDFSNWAAKTGDDWKDEATSATNNAWGKPRGFGAFLSQVFQGLLSGIGGVFGFLSGLFELRWAQVDTHDVQIVDLQDRSQILEGIIGYGQWYAVKSPMFSGDRQLVFNQQVGPVVGCRNDGGGRITLNSRGLWRCEVQIQTSVALGAGHPMYAEVVVRDPSTTVFARRRAEVRPPDITFGAGTAKAGSYVALAFVVPEAGYTVEGRVWSQGNRYVYGGAVYNGMTVNKVSAELGPGMRLQLPRTAPTSYAKLTPMAATGGGTVDDNVFIVSGAITAARIDATVIGSGSFDARIMRNGSQLVAGTGAAAHSLEWSGTVAEDDQIWIETRSSSGAVNISANNSTYMTVMNTDQLSADDVEPT